MNLPTPESSVLAVGCFFICCYKKLPVIAYIMLTTISSFQLVRQAISHLGKVV